MPSSVVRWWRSHKERLQNHFADYGAIAVVTYLVIFAATFAGFAIAIARGLEVDGLAGEAGTPLAAWLATKATQPLRILATLGLTPMVAVVWHRVRPRPSPPTD